MDINEATNEATNEKSFLARELNKLKNDESVSFECKCVFLRDNDELTYSIQINEDKIGTNVLISPKTLDPFIVYESNGKSLNVFLLKTKTEEKE